MAHPCPEAAVESAVPVEKAANPVEDVVLREDAVRDAKNAPKIMYDSYNLI
jgi:hypothetical protein